MPKFGEVREDGKVYIGTIRSGRRAGYELWSTQEVAEKRRASVRAASSSKAAKKKARLASDPEYRAQYNLQREEYRRADYRMDMLARAKVRAARGGYPCTITRGDIPFVTHCPVLGVELTAGEQASHNFSPTLDKIRPELGYVKGNIIVVSFLANRIKSDATPEQIMAVAKFYKKLQRSNS